MCVSDVGGCGVFSLHLLLEIQDGWSAEISRLPVLHWLSLTLAIKDHLLRLPVRSGEQIISL